ncbi:tRNA lysidine(34) synthetase TilS [Luteithermobacter gelatinilyticus]|uniref:tRNA lysidine(34) synthetase TilS n=1 Tax=Luteithermobacter gelatinilyticus TaxID=2582913 RepID=UPI001105AE13|nr:tRNA lysidine(34) synthetase TilS [Luteithermobacter gelatinilyticus]
MDHDKSSTTPLSHDEFSALMAEALEGVRLPEGALVAAGVSGGADSMALTLLLDRWCRAKGYNLVALTVDHGLRAASSQETRQVSSWLGGRKIRHKILSWQGRKPSASLQENARRARYQLMGEWAAGQGVSLLCLAHHQEDQAETFLLRLARGSGVDGLSAMKPLMEYPLIGAYPDPHRLPRLCRPLLDIPRERLRATLRVQHQDWIEDPSNEDRRHARVRVRQFLQHPEIDGLTPRRLADTARRMGQVQKLLNELMHEVMTTAVRIDPLGYVTVDREAIRAAHREIVVRLLAVLVREVGGKDYGPRFEKIEKLYEALHDPDFKGQTIGGCVVRPGQGSARKHKPVVVCREVAAVNDVAELQPGQALLWDGRFRIYSPRIGGQVVVMGVARWHELCHKTPDLKTRWMAPPEAVVSLPCLIDRDGVERVPHLATQATGQDVQMEFVRFWNKT